MMATSPAPADVDARIAAVDAEYLEQMLEVHGPYSCKRCSATGVEPGSNDKDCSDCGGAGNIASLSHPKFLEHIGLLDE